MSLKYFDSIVINGEKYEDIDKDLIDTASNLYKIVDEKMNALRANEALEAIFDLLRKCNKYIDETAPWIVAKDESKKERLSTIIYNILESLRISAILLKPFIPETSERIFNQLNTDVTNYDSVKTFGGLKKGSKLNAPEPLFIRIVNE
jgi:methionyl-tRNA synthetase